MIRRLILGGIATTLVAAPLAAESATADSRGSAPIEGESELAGQAPFLFLAGIAAIAAAVLLLSEDNDPASP